MDTLNYVFQENALNPPTELYLDDKLLRIKKNSMDVSYPLEDVRKVNLSYHPKDENRSSYSCTVTFEDGYAIEICDSQDTAYVNFVVKLHQALVPFVKQVSFTKTCELNHVHFNLPNVLRIFFGGLLLILLSPLILLVMIISLPFWGPAAIGFVVNLITSASYYLRHNVSTYLPSELPNLQIPVNSRNLTHQYMSEH